MSLRPMRTLLLAAAGIALSMPAVAAPRQAPAPVPASPPAPPVAATKSSPIPKILLTPITSKGVGPITDPPGDPEAALFDQRAEERHYAHQFRQLREKYFSSQRSDVRAKGFAELSEFKDPASFQPMIEAFGGEKDDVKLAMLDHFAANGGYGQAALAYVAITDPDKAIRHEATRRIRTPVCDDVLRVVDNALRQPKDDVANSAGLLAGNLNIIQAIPPMIMGQVAAGTGRGQGDLAWIAVGKVKTYVANVVPIVGDNSGAFAPVIGSIIEGTVLVVHDAVAYSYRGDMHNSLVAMSSADFGAPTDSLGFDAQAWVTWFNEKYVPFKQKQAEELAMLERYQQQQPATAAKPPSSPRPSAPPPEGE